ncbi:4387_t:CDS:10 [Dentiscutata heterogama]|uniref:4387_t:CDS:1 n=1 Tax=Dentiscutata heterogama TaxID=1316150 RepID=A0ACA9K4R2_9GLOM|nr:4387_t:CDS:10 [Dentiscutata heterogama]
MFLEKAKFWQTGGVCMQVYQFITMPYRIWLKAIIPDYRNSSIYDTSTTTKFPSKNLSDLDGSSNDHSKQIPFSSKKILSNNINSQNDNIPNYLKSRKPHHHLKPALKAYMESFDFEKDPIDIALRKLLMECHLPKETQQIDRVMEAFAKRYHELNPDLFASADDVDVNGQTMLESPTTDHRQLKIFSSSKDKRKSLRPRNDPYYVIQTKQPTEFKPYIKDIIPVENPYSYIGTLPSLDIANLHRSFSSAQTIRITGVQNRRNGDSFSTTTSSFQPSKDGTFLLKITKGGKLGRKIDLIDGKKKGGRNWKLYGKSPKLPVLKPDAILMTADSVAVYDKSYDKYKNVFRLVCPQGHQYLFQAENEIEMNDWISKINYAATFKTVGLKIRNIRSSITSGMSSFSASLFKIIDVNENDNDTGLGNGLGLGLGLDGIKFGNSGISRRDAKRGNDKYRTFPRLKEDNAKDAQGPTKLRHTCLELSRLVCYHEILEKDLCATVMEDDRYWLNRRSMYRLCGESSSEDNVSLIGSITGGDDRVSAMMSSILNTENKDPPKKLLDIKDIKDISDMTNITKSFGYDNDDDFNTTNTIKSSNSPSITIKSDDDNKGEVKDKGKNEKNRTVPMSLLPKSSTSSLSSMQYSSNGGDSYGGGSSQTTVSQHDEEEFVYRHGNASEFDLGFENVGKVNNLDDIKDDDVESFTFENNNHNIVKVDINNDIDSMKDRSDIIDLQTIDPRIIEALSITDNSPSDVFNNIIKENDSLPLVETNIPKSSIMTSLVINDDYEFSDSEEDDDEFVDAEEYI